MWVFTVFLLVLFIHSALLSTGDELLLVQALWRHGDRAPANTYPKDPYQESTWPQGWGHLSATGMEQSFTLGIQLRAMYDNFINSSYNPCEIYIRSTDYDRTLMSAMSSMAGLYPNGTARVTYPSSKIVPDWPRHWSPIPVHALESASNNVLNPFARCPRAERLLAMSHQSDLYKKILQEKQPFFDFLTYNTGMKVSLGSGIHSLQDVLSIEKANNMKMPDWLNETVWNDINNLTRIFHGFNFGLLPNVLPKMIMFRGGSLLKTIVKDMQHDTTLTALLTTFDLSLLLDKGLPGYASCILVELWNTEHDGPQVKILYRSSFKEPFLPITNLIGGCPTNSDYCPFATFVMRSEKYMPTDISVECQIQQ